MYSIINFKNPESLKDIVNIENSTIYCVSLSMLTKLTNYTEYPISNKRIALINILNLLRHIDTQLKSHDYRNNTLPLSRVTLEEFLSRNKYKAYMKILKALEILSPVPYDDNSFYKISEKNMQYRLHSEVAYSEDICLCIFDSKIKPEYIQDYNSYHDKFVYTIKDIRIDYTEAIKAEINNYINNGTELEALRKRLNTIFSLASKRFIKTGSKSNRIYHSLSNISRISRPYLRLQDSSFNDIDIVNCQPLLLCYLLKKRGMALDINYVHDCTSGTFYEQFVTEDITRDKVKVELYRTIFFDFKKSEVNLKFKELYPATWASLALINKEKETLASQLQNIEADIFNNIVPVNSEGYFTLFDAVYFTDITDAYSIAEYITGRFREYGLQVSIKLNGGNYHLPIIKQVETIAEATSDLLAENKKEILRYMNKTGDVLKKLFTDKIAETLTSEGILFSYNEEEDNTDAEFFGITVTRFITLIKDGTEVTRINCEDYESLSELESELKNKITSSCK